MADDDGGIRGAERGLRAVGDAAPGCGHHPGVVAAVAERNGLVEFAAVQLGEDFERAALADTGILSAPDKYITAVYPQRECFLDYFDSDTLLIVSEFSNVSDRLKSYDFQNSEITEKLISSGRMVPWPPDGSRTMEAAAIWVRMAPW